MDFGINAFFERSKNLIKEIEKDIEALFWLLEVVNLPLFLQGCMGKKVSGPSNQVLYCYGLKKTKPESSAISRIGGTTKWFNYSQWFFSLKRGTSEYIKLTF
uniref:Uncharacterized protein n=1 Tax=Micrurus paraensis TaxID=1970185 RepID=A0A2D4L1D0_9SAUR